jgi:predicted Kef-type K+ transport protein
MNVEIISECLNKVGSLFVFGGLGGSFLLTQRIKKRIVDIPLYHIALLYLLGTLSLLIYVGWSNELFVGIGFSLIFAATIFLSLTLFFYPFPL